MGYKKASEVLPQELLVMIQDYIEGDCIYIPRKEENKKTWGERTKAKKLTYERNLEIYKKYKEGCSIDELADRYCLSIKSIQGIVLKIKREVA